MFLLYMQSLIYVTQAKNVVISVTSLKRVQRAKAKGIERSIRTTSATTTRRYRGPQSPVDIDVGPKPKTYTIHHMHPYL